MVDTVRHPRESETTPELDIELRGRAYPRSCRRAMPLPDIPPDMGIETKDLRHRILTMLSFPGRHPETIGGSTEIVRTFCNDMVLLESMAQQWRSFLKCLRKANINTVFAEQIPKRQQQRALDQALQAMGHESRAMVDDGGVLNGDLVEQAPLHVFQTLQATLKRVVTRFTGVMQSDLDQLSDLRVVGLLEWCGEKTCRFHFYEHKVTSVVDHAATERQSVPMTRHGKTKVGAEILKVLAGRHIHSVTRRAELLIEAESRSASDPQLVLPERVRDCIRQCPAWLRPELNVVEGEKVREEWVELVRMERQWQERQWQERWCQQRIQPHFDPALTLFGQFVLMGWDEKAHQKEIHNRIRHSRHQLQQSAVPQEPACQNGPLTQMIAWIVAVVFGILVALATGGTLGNILVPLLSLACLPATYHYLSGGRRLSNLNEQDDPRPFFASLSAMFTVTAVGYFLAAWVLPEPLYCVLTVPACVGAAFFRMHSRKGGAA